MIYCNKKRKIKCLIYIHIYVTYLIIKFAILGSETRRGRETVARQSWVLSSSHFLTPSQATTQQTPPTSSPLPVWCRRTTPPQWGWGLARAPHTARGLSSSGLRSETYYISFPVSTRGQTVNFTNKLLKSGLLSRPEVWK